LDSVVFVGLHRLITANFLHDSFVHLGASCYALATVAPAIEEVLGWDIFLGVYMLSAVAGSVGTFIFGDAITVGASSGIFGVIGEHGHTAPVRKDALLHSRWMALAGSSG
jgi:membrane associated rhomboid family serine protease